MIFSYFIKTEKFLMEDFMDTALVKLNWISLLPCKKDNKIIVDGQLKKELCEEFENEEWSIPYTDIDELFKDLEL